MKRRNKKEVEIVKEQEKEIINVVSAEKKGFKMNKKTGIIIGAVIALVGAGVVIVKSLGGFESTDYDLDDFEEEDEDSEE